MVGGESQQLKPRLRLSLISSFVAGYLLCSRQQCLPQHFSYNPGRKHVSMQLSRTFSGLIDFLFNGRNIDELPNSKRKHLRPGEVSPPQPVPKYIPRPTYVNSKTPLGLVSGLEVHDDQGIECKRASGRLAEWVLQYAGTSVKA